MLEKIFELVKEIPQELHTLAIVLLGIALFVLGIASLVSAIYITRTNLDREELSKGNNIDIWDLILMFFSS